MLKFSGLTLTAKGILIATSDDPQIVVSRRLFSPKFLLFSLESRDLPLDPIIYFDRGRGFSESDQIRLPIARQTHCVVPLASMRDVRRVRFDPASWHASFRFNLGQYHLGRSLLQAVQAIRPRPIPQGVSLPQPFTTADPLAHLLPL